MATSLQKILLAGGAVVALTWAAVQGSQALVAVAKDRRELQDPASKLPELRAKAQKDGLAMEPVAETAVPEGDARPVLGAIKNLLVSDHELSRITNGITDGSALDKAHHAAELRALIDKMLACPSYVAYDQLDHLTIFGTIDRSAERVGLRVACVDAEADIKAGRIDRAVTRLDEVAGFLTLLADHVDENGVVAWYAGVRLMATAMAKALGSPDVTEAQIAKVRSSLERASKGPALDKVCTRMMNELVATTRGIDKLSEDNLLNLNMNGMNTRPPRTDPLSKKAMEAGLLEYYTSCIDTAKSRDVPPLERGRLIDQQLVPFQKEDRVDRYMLRTITPVTYQLGQTINLGNEILACTHALAAASRLKLAGKAYPTSLPARENTVDIEGCRYDVVYEQSAEHPAVYSRQKKLDNYDVRRHVSVDPVQGVYVNL